MAVRLEWDGKPKGIERISLPFQTVETINESRATRERDAGSLLKAEVSSVLQRNQLIWGDNKLVMGSLLSDHAGAVDLIYIDPPFATGDDFSMSIPVGQTNVAKAPSILEEQAYRDTWGAGYDSYLSMMYERLALMWELLSSNGVMVVHLDWRVAPYARLMLDELFGPEAFVNELIWRYGKMANATRRFSHAHDQLIVYCRGPEYSFNPQGGGISEYRNRYERWVRDDETLRFGDVKRSVDKLISLRIKKVSKELDRPLEDEDILFDFNTERKALDDVFTDVSIIKGNSAERTAFPTQKPEGLLTRVISAFSNPGDLVADLFAGSGTTAVVAERLGRRWIACDLGRFAIHTTRKRLLNVEDCSPFDIKNLGAYERQRWQVASGNGALRAYLDTILAFYRADPVAGFAHLHGRKAGRMVHVGATDAPVTIDETEDVMDEMADNGIESCDLLGWEWEMGLHDTISETARRRGLDVRPRQIPREVMERRAVEADAVRFFELAHVDLDIRRQSQEACVVLKDFAIPSEELIPPKVRERVESWSDLIDYWSVDYDFSDGVFHNQWQAYRTRENPALATQSDWHEYPDPGRYSIIVKIIDIFGNDTTKLAEVRIK